MQSYKPIDKVTFAFLQTSNQGQKCPQTAGAETLLFCMGVKLRKTCITIRKKCLTVAHVEVNFCMTWLPSQWSQVIDLRNVFYLFKHDASFFQVNRLTWNKFSLVTKNTLFASNNQPMDNQDPSISQKAKTIVLYFQTSDIAKIRTLLSN